MLYCKKILCALFLTLSLNCFACLNYFYTVDREGDLHVDEGVDNPFNINFDLDRNFYRLKSLEKKLKSDSSYQVLSDYTVNLMKVGKTKEALNILRVLVQHYPNDYRINSNLGTAYELNGKNDSALYYIKKTIVLNPNDHEGSEWIHVKILEFKIKLSQKDISVLQPHSVLHLTDAQKQDSTYRKHIEIQARERFPFTPKNDFVMADLMEDLGDCYTATSSLDFAKICYRISKDYFGNTNSEVKDKIKSVQNLLNQYSIKQPPKTHIEGSHSRLSLSYKSMLEDHQKYPSKTDLNKIISDPAELLQMAMLIPVSAPLAVISNKIDSLKVEPKPIMINPKQREEVSSSWWIFLLAGAVLLLGVVVVKRKKKG